MTPQQKADLAARNIHFGNPVPIVPPTTRTNLRRSISMARNYSSADGVAPSPLSPDKAQAFLAQLADGLGKVGFEVEPTDVEGMKQALDVLGEDAGFDDNAPPSDGEVESEGRRLGLTPEQIKVCRETKCHPRNFVAVRRDIFLTPAHQRQIQARAAAAASVGARRGGAR